MQKCPDGVCRAIGIAIDISIPKPGYPVSLAAEMRITPLVTSAPAILTMLTAIDFNDQLVRLAYEIEDVTIKGRLPAEVIALAAPCLSLTQSFTSSGVIR